MPLVIPFLITLSFLLVVPAHADSLDVVLDPGHGGIDTGAKSGRLRESDIVLQISKDLAALLRADPRFRVTLTRSTDETISLVQRAHIARREQGDVFLSIHANASADSRASGLEFYFQNQLPADEEALFMASREGSIEDAEITNAPVVANENMSRHGDLVRILDDLHRNYRLNASHDLTKSLLQSWGTDNSKKRNRAIRQAPFFLVSQVNMPSVLVEVGFLTHRTEGAKLGSPIYQKEIAHILYQGLVNFKEVMDKDRGRSLH